jgi:uncharacterized protein YndB with AHSA1/START domain
MILNYDSPLAGTPGKTSAKENVVDVRFTQIELNRRIVQVVDFQSDDPAFFGPMTMTWTLTPADGGKEVRIASQSDKFVERPARADEFLNHTDLSLQCISTRARLLH